MSRLCGLQVGRLNEGLVGGVVLSSGCLVWKQQRALRVGTGTGATVAARSGSYGHVPLSRGPHHDTCSARLHLVAEDRRSVDGGVDGRRDSWVYPGCCAVLSSGEGDVVEHKPVT